MPTANFNLPLIDPAAPISIVNDMNALATAADSAMGTLATSGDIASVRQVANNATAVAQEANANAQDAQGAAKTANEAAVAAQNTATVAQNTATAAQNTANGAAASVNAITRNDVTTYSLGTAKPSTTLASSGSVTLSVSKSAASNIAMVEMAASAFDFVGGWNENLTMPVKLPEALRPKSTQRYLVFMGWFAAQKPLNIEITFNPNGDVQVLLHPHGVTDNYSITAINTSYMVGA